MTTTKKPRKPRPIKLKGFNCPGCLGVPLDAIRTRRGAKGVIVRRRECPICGYRITTEERPKAA